MIKKAVHNWVLINGFLFCLFLTNAQESKSRILESNITNSDDILLVAPPRKLDEKVDGSPYIHEDFKPSKINAGKKTELIRYNATLDAMEVLNDKEDIFILSPSYSYEIKLLDGSNKIYENYNFKVENEIKKGYFVLIKELGENLKLYKKENIRFVKGSLAKSSLEQDIPSRFKREKDSYFIKEGTNQIKIIPMAKKEFLKEFQNKNMKSYMKKNKLTLKNEAHLIDIMTYYYQ